MTRKLLQHWTDPDLENTIDRGAQGGCVVEALETLIYLTEAARRVGDHWIENWLRDANEGANPGLNRIAMKMATGSGKTVVMAMLIAWQALNKIGVKGIFSVHASFDEIVDFIRKNVDQAQGVSA